MGGEDASEPELSPAYVAMHEAYRRATELEAIDRRRESIRTAMATEYDHLERLWGVLEAEEAELAAAESKAERLTLPPVRRRRKAAADLERADVDAVRAELVERQRVWDELSVSLGPAPGFDLDRELETARADLERAVAEWRHVHAQAGTELARWLGMSERATGEVEAQMAEVAEAADLLMQAWQSLLVARRASLRPTETRASFARAWITPGRAGQRDHATRTALSVASAGFRRRLLLLEPELKDLYRRTRRELTPPPSLQRQLDAWFNGPYSRWLATGQLDLGFSAVTDGEELFMALRDELLAFHGLLQHTLAELEQERTARLLEHPGVV